MTSDPNVRIRKFRDGDDLHEIETLHMLPVDAAAFLQIDPEELAWAMEDDGRCNVDVEQDGVLFHYIVD